MSVLVSNLLLKVKKSINWSQLISMILLCACLSIVAKSINKFAFAFSQGPHLQPEKMSRCVRILRRNYASHDLCWFWRWWQRFVPRRLWRSACFIQCSRWRTKISRYVMCFFVTNWNLLFNIVLWFQALPAGAMDALDPIILAFMQEFWPHAIGSAQILEFDFRFLYFY